MSYGNNFMIVLIMENTRSLEKTASYLFSSGFDVKCYSGIFPNTNEIARDTPDIIVCDLMTDNSGIEFVKKAKSSPQLCNVPIILLYFKSSEYDVTEKFDEIKPYVAASIVKPCSASDLVNVIKNKIFP